MVRNLGHGVVAGTQHHHLDATGQCVARCQVVVSATQTHKLAQHSHTHARARTHTRTHTRAHALTQHSQHSQHTNSHTTHTHTHTHTHTRTHTHTITHYSLTTTHARTHASRPGATYPGFAVVGNRGNQNGLPFLTNVERPCACNWEVPEGKGDTKGGLVQRQGKEADNTKNMPRTQARVANLGSEGGQSRLGHGCRPQSAPGRQMRRGRQIRSAASHTTAARRCSTAVPTT